MCGKKKQKYPPEDELMYNESVHTSSMLRPVGDSRYYPVPPPREHGPGCVVELALLEKHSAHCKHNKMEGPGTTPDDVAGSYHVVGRVTYHMCARPCGPKLPFPCSKCEACDMPPDQCDCDMPPGRSGSRFSQYKSRSRQASVASARPTSRSGSMVPPPCSKCDECDMPPEQCDCNMPSSRSSTRMSQYKSRSRQTSVARPTSRSGSIVASRQGSKYSRGSVFE